MNDLADVNDLEERAFALVSLSHALAISSSHLRDREAFLNSIDDYWWDLIITTGCIFIAATRLRNLAIPSALQDGLMKIVAEKFDDWNPKDALRSFDDCKAFFDRTYPSIYEAATEEERQFASSDTVGGWMMWNLMDHLPESEDERRMVRGLGILVTHAIFNFWAES